MIIRDDCTCPLEYVHDIIKGKWKLVILWQIYYNEKSSLSELERQINKISQKMLLQQLNELREYDLVDKYTYPGYPLKVEYFLTADKGHKIIAALKIMQELGTEYLTEKNHTH